MEIFGIGPLELLFIALIAIIVLGPKDIVKTGKTIGRFLNQLVKSPGYRSVVRTSQELRQLPTKLIREAGLEESIKEINQISNKTNLTDPIKDLQKLGDINSWTTPPAIDDIPGDVPPEPKIEPSNETPEIKEQG